jgi:hypothetical protein
MCFFMEKENPSNHVSCATEDEGVSLCCTAKLRESSFCFYVLLPAKVASVQAAPLRCVCSATTILKARRHKVVDQLTPDWAGKLWCTWFTESLSIFCSSLSCQRQDLRYQDGCPMPAVHCMLQSLASFHSQPWWP